MNYFLLGAKFLYQPVEFPQNINLLDIMEWKWAMWTEFEASVDFHDFQSWHSPWFLRVMCIHIIAATFWFVLEALLLCMVIQNLSELIHWLTDWSIKKQFSATEAES
jgi:hypothetical protein